MKLNIKLFLLCISFSANTFSSQVMPIDYTTIKERASHILIGYVASKTEDSPKGTCSTSMYEASIQITTTIKGKADKNNFVLPVCIGHKGFNRHLTLGKNYIFFLTKSKGGYRRVHSIGAVGEF